MEPFTSADVDHRVDMAQNEAVRRLTLRDHGKRPIGINLEEGAELSRQATMISGFATR